MLIFLYGPDDYRRKEKEKFYLSEFKKKYSHLGVGKFDLVEEGQFEAFQEFVRTQSIFEPMKLVLLGHCEGAVESIQKNLIQELKTFAEYKETTIILSFSKKPIAAFGALFRKAFSTEEFAYLGGSAWEMFIRKETKNQNVKLSEDAVRFLAQAYGGDTWRLVTELQKLALLGDVIIDRKKLETLDIEITPDFWGLLNGLKSPDLRGRLVALERIFAEGESSAKVFNIAAYQLSERLPQMAAYDLAVKSGKMDYEEALLDLALS